jgi:tartrate dehydratase alpha subunit/fumarate hydratase class I-like protein
MGLANLQSGLGGTAQDFSRAQIAGLGSLGSAQQAQAQAVLDADRQTAQMAVQDPIRRLNMLGSGVTGLMGGASGLGTTIGEAPQSASSSPLATALGTGLMGADIYGRIFK